MAHRPPAPLPPPQSGDGFVVLADGSRRWGRFGAAGVLARHRGDGPAYFVAQRSLHCHQGGTWAVPGGALHRGETPVEGAVREFEEEIGPLPPRWQVTGVHEDDHGGWSYWTVLVDVPDRFPPPAVLHWETADARWAGVAELARLALLPPFRATLQRLGVLPAAR